MTPSADSRTERKRQTILAAGQELFLSQGFQGTSVDQIAARAQVSKQTVYKQFGDKQQLLFTIVSAVLDRIAGPVIERIAALAHTKDLESDLVELAVDYLHAVLAEPVVQLRRLVIAEANRLPELADVYYQRAPARTLSVLADTFGHLNERGLLDVPVKGSAAEHFAFLVVGKPLDHALFYGGSHTLARIEPRDHARAAARVFLAAYRAGNVDCGRSNRTR
ncbi:TetR/AcrR family transcriptional regulator [uncultured Mycobacterium sp.]|uniref:TetR/AcrR family transcriptional regulator n=1 Tax=uncultured Mycobacterium sp. TaxID=171292 RepID=UPI0035CAE578